MSFVTEGPPRRQASHAIRRDPESRHVEGDDDIFFYFHYRLII